MALIECSECGGKLSDRARTCPHCGAPPTLSIKCEECGRKLKDEAAPCPHCGAPPPVQPPIAGTRRAWLIVIAVIAGLPSLFFFVVASNPNQQNGGPVGFLGFLWVGAVWVAYTLINRALDKAVNVVRVARDRANAATRFATDQVERRTVATERQVDAETIHLVAGAGKLADASDTARKWTTRTDAFGRIVGAKSGEAEE